MEEPNGRADWPHSRCGMPGVDSLGFLRHEVTWEEVAWEEVTGEIDKNSLMAWREMGGWPETPPGWSAKDRAACGQELREESAKCGSTE